MDNETFFDNGREYYKATNRRVWPHRDREHPSAQPGDEEHLGALIDTKYVRLMLERLDELEKKTRPSASASSGDAAEGKDLAARQAMTIVAGLVRYAAGWAIDHQVGLAIEGLEFVPLPPSATGKHPKYLRERSLVDRHQHEKEGGIVPCREEDNPRAVRRCLLNLLRSNPGGMPGWLVQKAIDGLEALDYGEVQPLFAPVSSGRKRDLTLLKLQLRAIATVEYRRRLGFSKEKALAVVSDALNVSPHTPLSWEPRLRNEFGELKVMNEISIARNHASWVLHEQGKKLRGEPAGDVEIHEVQYNEAALIELARKYRVALQGN